MPRAGWYYQTDKFNTEPRGDRVDCDGTGVGSAGAGRVDCADDDGADFTCVTPPPGSAGAGCGITEKAERELAASMRSIVRRIG